MYNDLKQLKKMKGLTDDVKRRIEKAWVWGLITDEQFEELMEMKLESLDTDNVESSDTINTENLSE